MHKTLTSMDLPGLSVVAFASACLIAAVLDSLMLSVLFAAFGISIYVICKNRNRKNGSSELHGFLTVVCTSYKRNRDILAAVEEGTKVSDFDWGLGEKIERYRFGDVGVFSGHSTMAEDPLVTELLAIVVSSLADGTDVYARLIRLRKKAAVEIKYKLKLVGAMNNASFVNLAGIALFFPLFAGISLSILGSSAQLGLGAQANTSAILVVFTAYIVIASATHFSGEKAVGALNRAGAALLTGGFALLVLRVAAFFASSVI